jgi:hypothetical protein
MSNKYRSTYEDIAKIADELVRVVKRSNQFCKIGADDEEYCRRVFITMLSVFCTQIDVCFYPVVALQEDEEEVVSFMNKCTNNIYLKYESNVINQLSNMVH